MTAHCQSLFRTVSLAILTSAFSSAAFAHGANDDWMPLFWLLGGLLFVALVFLAFFIYGLFVFRGWSIIGWILWSLGSGAAIALLLFNQMELASVVCTAIKVPAELLAFYYMRGVRKIAQPRRTSTAQAKKPDAPASGA